MDAIESVKKRVRDETREVRGEDVFRGFYKPCRRLAFNVGGL